MSIAGLVLQTIDNLSMETTKSSGSSSSTEQLKHVIEHGSKYKMNKHAILDTLHLLGQSSSVYKINNAVSSLIGVNYEYHIYCEKCQIYTGFDRNEKAKKCCQVCSKQLKMSETNYFIYLPVRSQIINTMNMYFNDIISYRDKMKLAGPMKDVHQGQIFKRIEKKMGSESMTLSLVINTDGAQLFNSSKFSVWPIQFYQNYLPPTERYLPKNIIVAGLYYGLSHRINLHEMLKPICEEFSAMKNGFPFEYEGAQLSLLPVITHCVVDLPARAKIQCMVGHNAPWSCSFCLSEGTRVLNTTSKKKH